MFDKMHLRGGEISEKALVQMGAQKCPGDGQYRKVYRLNLGDSKSFNVRMDPYYAPASTSVEFNPSKFDSWPEATGILGNFSHEEAFIIDRLDYATDIEMPYVKVWKSIRVARKQSSSYWQTMTDRKGPQVTGYVTGEKPEVFCIYDKGCEVTKKLKFKRVPGLKFGDCTRVEVRHFNQKVPFTSLDKISEYLNFNPFEKIQFWELKPLAADEFIVRAFLPELEARGFEGFYVKYNSSGNFHRTYARYFEQKPLADKLREDHWLSLGKYLMGQE